MRRTLALGGLLAVVYVGAVLGTRWTAERNLRPLFDAVGPPPAYRWVNPPPDFEAGNDRPKPTEIGFGLKPEDLPPAGSSEDSQFVFNLPQGAIPISGADVKGIARIEPHDPDTLGALPPRQFADGNAYRIQFRYDPSGGPAAVGQTGSLLMTVPVPATAVLYSEDGQTWREVKSQHASATAVGGELPGAGYYLAVSPDAVADLGGGGGGLAVPIAITVLVAGFLVAMPMALRRRRPPPTRQARRQANRTRGR